MTPDPTPPKPARKPRRVQRTPTPDPARIAAILAALAELYPDTGTALTHADPFQLTIATILSAQCTDARVNIVTPALFARFPNPAAFAAARLTEIQKYIRSTGFYRNKAKNIKKCCQMLVKKHGGAVPGTLAELVQLPGVGRKTANVVLGDGFGVPGITVDTHVGRLSRRLGLTIHADPVKVEHDLNKWIPQPEWTRFSHRLIFHGRQVCKARSPRCDACALRPHCPQVGVSSSSVSSLKSKTAVRRGTKTPPDSATT